MGLKIETVMFIATLYIQAMAAVNIMQQSLAIFKSSYRMTAFSSALAERRISQ
jgi:hypothetical protein